MQKHLKKVYGTLSISMLAASAGAYVHLFTGILSVSICGIWAFCGFSTVNFLKFSVLNTHCQGKQHRVTDPDQTDSEEAI